MLYWWKECLLNSRLPAMISI